MNWKWIAAIVMFPVGYWLGGYLSRVYGRWRIRRMWKRQARSTAWLWRDDNE